MAISVQKRSGGHQLRVTHRLLPRPFFHTFADEAAARAYGLQLRELLDQGIVPTELLAQPAKSADDALVATLVRGYLDGAPGLTDSDNELLTSILQQREVEALRVSGVTAKWCDDYVMRLKRRQLAPGTIRKRVGALARVIDWHQRLEGRAETRANALRMMPAGYSQYSQRDVIELGKRGLQARRDLARDRRLLPDEEARVRDALAGVKRPDRERLWPADTPFAMLFDLILGTGMRLSEAYKLRVDQLDLPRRVARIEGSKGARGQTRPRVVPLRPGLADQLQAYCEGRIGLLFPYWDGSKEDARRASGRLSQRFHTLFAYAGVDGFTEHDLRHEATCRWFTLRDERGAWVFSDLEICRIMGWTSTQMALRYASLRGEDLAARLV